MGRGLGAGVSSPGEGMPPRVVARGSYWAEVEADQGTVRSPVSNVHVS